MKTKRTKKISVSEQAVRERQTDYSVAPKTKVVVVIEGGVVQTVFSNKPAECLVIDYDKHSEEEPYHLHEESALLFDKFKYWEDLDKATKKEIKEFTKD